MKKILLIAIALIAMIGITAASEQINVYEVGSSTVKVNSLSLVPGTSVEKDLLVSEMSTVTTNTSHYLSYYVNATYTPPGESTASTDIEVEFKEITPSGSWSGIASPLVAYQWNQTTSSQSELLKIRFKATSSAPVEAEYEIWVGDSLNNVVITPSASATAFKAVLTVNAITVPEFPTIALPVAAILGLAFFFQRRREED